MKTICDRGFTLIELLITMSIFAFLVMMGGPMYADFLGNTQVRNAAESALNGLRLAQTEAVRGNMQAKFVLDPAPATGGWTVFRYNDGDGNPADLANCPPSGAPQWCLVQRYTVADGAAKIDGLVTDNPAATTVLFSGLGRIVPNSSALVGPNGSPTIARIDVANGNVSASSRRPLRVVVVSAAGTSAIKLCDPSPSVATVDPHDPRICPLT